MSARPPQGLPGLRGTEHIGLTVPDFDAAVDFFVRIIGCDFILDGGTYADPDFMERQIGVDRAALDGAGHGGAQAGGGKGGTGVCAVESVGRVGDGLPTSIYRCTVL